MGALNKGCIKAGGKVIGVIHKMWVVDNDELQHGLTELKIVEGQTLAERKRYLNNEAQAFIALPGLEFFGT